ncbi:PREDICTED: transcriptional protein SWT1-like [Nicrophorus vespilloides]|uniref:Transcriptional protein SWT1-like n=1 Tax=Nicrophorus vespilloides TaxID=110193 RepID=A0ABM1MTX1_NICVS|nr:PREDICTED: transcriptional protein SWT1-like [Nicrophorus vespilloides]
MEFPAERKILKGRRRNKGNTQSPCKESVHKEPVQISRGEERCLANNRLKRLRASLGSSESPIKKRVKSDDHNVTTPAQSRLNSTKMCPSSPNISAHNNNVSNCHMITSTPNKRTSTIDISDVEPPLKKHETAVVSSSGDSMYHSDLSNVSLICNASTERDLDNCDMEMDTDNASMSEEHILDDIQSLRKQREDGSPQKTNFSYFNLKYENIQKSDNIYIVVDTNVFIDKLQTIIDILKITFCDDTKPVIYVPWMVIQELDYFKDGYGVKSKQLQKECRKAIKFINECLVAKKDNLIGESAMESAQNQYQGRSADDSILGSCLRIAQQNTTILMSSDVNLRNKCLINKIDPYCPTKVLEFLRNYKKTKNQVDAIENVSKSISFLLSYILKSDSFVESSDLPWEFKKCVSYMKKSYDDLFRSGMQKQCRKVINDLSDLLDSEDINEHTLIELSLSLLLYLKAGKPMYQLNIQKCIEEVTDIKKQF